MSAKELRKLAENYAENYGYKRSQLGRGYESFAAHLFAGEVGFRDVYDDDDLIGGSILRHKDLGVDVVLDDPLNKVLLLCQVKWSSKAPKHEDAEAFFALHDKLKDRNYIRKGSPEAQDLLGDYGEKVKDGYTVILRFVASSPLSGDAGDRFDLETLAAQAAYDERGLKIRCELWRRNDVWMHHKSIESLSGGIPDIDINLRQGTYEEFFEPRHGLVARVSGGELRNLYRRRDVAERLFQQNIRLPLGNRGLNSKIAETAAQEPDDFFFYNNGVSAVCSEFRLDDGVLSAKRFQVVNGAQTIGALSSAKAEERIGDVDVLFRLTATGESYGGMFTEKVIRYNNTQNRIEDPDFRSNDPIQTFLHEHLNDYSSKGPLPSFYYQAKRGQKKPKGRQGKALKPQRLAGLRHAFIHGPTVSYGSAKSLFDIEGKYWEAFGDGELTTEWTKDQLDEAMVALAVDEYLRNLKKPLEESESLEAKYIVRLSRYLTALVGVGLRERLGSDFHSWGELLTKTERFNEVVRPISKIAREVVLQEWMRAVDEGASQPAYNIGRSPELWGRLSKNLLQTLKSQSIE